MNISSWIDEAPKWAQRRRGGVVARAAAAGRGPTAGRASQRRFLSLVALVVMGGTLMVGFVWKGRQYQHPTVLDSWQNAYGVFDCQAEAWLAPFESPSNPDGIRSRGDGIVYIEPASDAVAGDNATLEVFLDAMGASLTDESLRLPDGTELSEQGTFCNGEEAVLQVRRWQAGADTPSDTRVADLADTVFRNDGDSIAIVFAPVNSTVPIPPSSADLPDPGTVSVASELDG